MSRKPQETRPRARRIGSALPTCIIMLLLACASTAAHANEPAGALDLPVTAVGNAVGKQNNGFTRKKHNRSRLRRRRPTMPTATRFAGTQSQPNAGIPAHHRSTQQVSISTRSVLSETAKTVDETSY